MAEDATPLVEALLAIIDAARAYLPGEIETDVFVTRVLQAVDNPPDYRGAGCAWISGLGGRVREAGRCRQLAHARGGDGVTRSSRFPYSGYGATRLAKAATRAFSSGSAISARALSGATH